jgi:signal transduction histidine kinase
MRAIAIEVPTLLNREGDRLWLFELARQLDQVEPLAVTFRFPACRDLRQNAIAFLGGLARLVESRGGSVTFDWDSCSQRILKRVQQNGFSQIFGGPAASSVGHTVPYREDLIQDPNAIARYLQENWLGRGWMNISRLLTDAIVGRVWEIYANAFEHGHSDVGVVTCGHHYQNTKELGLTVVDFGVGIPANVRGYLGKSVPASVALRWAFLRGTTTKRDVTSRGIGLDLLKEFVKLNNGRLEFYSHEGQAVITRERESFDELPLGFRGTLVTITFQCDGLSYRFADETEGPQQPLF